jgi:hypothetical protein
LCVLLLQPLLKHHNPRSFEDLSAPVPNFRTMNLKAGDVPKFFDAVLQGRADDAVDAVSGLSLLASRSPLMPCLLLIRKTSGGRSERRRRRLQQASLW